MQNINSVIQQAVSSIQGMEQKRKVFSKKLVPFLEKDLSVSRNLLEKRLKFSVKKAELECKVAGIDSGFVSKDLLALDLVLIRGVGTVFEYKNSKVAKASYYPNFFSFPEPHLSNHSLEADEFSCSKSIKRLMVEIGTAKEMIEKYSFEE